MSSIDLFFERHSIQTQERIVEEAKWWGIAHCAEKKTNLRYNPGDVFGWCRAHERFERLTEAHWWLTPHCPKDGFNLSYTKGQTEATCSCGKRLSLQPVKWSGQL